MGLKRLVSDGKRQKDVELSELLENLKKRIENLEITITSLKKR